MKTKTEPKILNANTPTASKASVRSPREGIDIGFDKYHAYYKNLEFQTHNDSPNQLRLQSKQSRMVLGALSMQVNPYDRSY